MTKNLNKGIEIELGGGFIPLRIGGIDFKFETSDQKQTAYFDKYAELMEKQEELKKFQKESTKLEKIIADNPDGDYSAEQEKFITELNSIVDDVTRLVKETVDCALGENAFNVLHEKANGDSEAVLEAFLKAMAAIKDYKQKNKLNKYIQDKKK